MSSVQGHPAQRKLKQQQKRQQQQQRLHFPGDYIAQPTGQDDEEFEDIDSNSSSSVHPSEYPNQRTLSPQNHQQQQYIPQQQAPPPPKRLIRTVYIKPQARLSPRFSRGSSLNNPGMSSSANMANSSGGVGVTKRSRPSSAGSGTQQPNTRQTVGGILHPNLTAASFPRGFQPTGNKTLQNPQQKTARPPLDPDPDSDSEDDPSQSSSSPSSSSSSSPSSSASSSSSSSSLPSSPLDPPRRKSKGNSSKSQKKLKKKREKRDKRDKREKKSKSRRDRLSPDDDSDDSEDDDDDDEDDYAWDALSNIKKLLKRLFRNIITSPFSMAKWTFYVLRTPIAYLVIAFISLLLIITILRGSLNLFSYATQPLCDYPIINKLLNCDQYESNFDWFGSTSWTKPPPTSDFRRADFPRLINLQTQFTGILQNAEASSILGLELKNAEMSIRDLGTLVKVSDLHCRDTLSAEIDRFVDESRLCTRQLRRLESGVVGVVDSAVSMNEYSIRELERVRDLNTEGSSGMFHVFFLRTFPFFNDNLSPAEHARVQISNLFMEATVALEKDLRRLIIDSEILLAHLEHLETRMDTVYRIVSTENRKLSTETDKVLAEIWTMLGGNKKKLANLNRHQNLLMNVNEYRTRALEQVGRTLHQLQGMYAGLEKLRENSSKDVLVEKGGIPLEVQIEALRRGAERLIEGRKGGKERMGKERDRIWQRAGADSIEVEEKRQGVIDPEVAEKLKPW